MHEAPSTVLTEAYTDAIAYATALHANQTRKGNTIPYTAHLLGVSSLVLEAGGTEEEAIAGLLHDAVEDCGGLATLEAIRSRFGDRVAEIVLACSDSTDEEWKRTVDYWERKQAYLDHLEVHGRARRAGVDRGQGPQRPRHRHRPPARGRRRSWTKFNGTPAEILTYYAECLRIGEAKHVPDALLWPLHTAVLEIDRYVMGGWPGDASPSARGRSPAPAHDGAGDLPRVANSEGA